MSWFSNPFASPSDPAPNDSDGDGEDAHPRSQGVKKDLSQLTQTFTKQLWGVASFLAPPQAKDPGAEYDDDDDGSAKGRASTTVRHDDHLAKSGLEELVDVDFESLLDETLEGPPVQASKDGTHSKEDSQSSIYGSVLPHSPAPVVEHGIIGISRDLAELKGSVASGFSHIVRAVRDEIEHVDSSTLDMDDTIQDEDDEINHKSTRSTRVQKSQGINTYLGPLIRHILPSEKRKDLGKMKDSSSEDGDDGSETLVNKEHNNARPSNFQDTFLHGFRGLSEFASSFISISLNSDNENIALERSRELQAVGITEEALAFAKDISMHREIWLDFSSLLDDEIDEFKMSATQKEHIQALEVASMELTALKTQLCPDYMSEMRFWKIYFVLLHSRLSKMDALLLSTPEITQAWAHLSQKLQEDENGGFELKELDSSKSHTTDSKQSSMDLAVDTGNSQSESVKGNWGRPQIGVPLIQFAEEVQNRNVVPRTLKLATSNHERADTNADQWLNEGLLTHVQHPPESRDEDDLSFSDLEEGDELITRDKGRSNSAELFDWVQLNKTSSIENFNGSKLQGSTFGDGTAQLLPQSSLQASRKHSRSESSDWSTVEEDAAGGSD